MRRITPNLPRAECLWRADEYERLAAWGGTAEGCAYALDQARLWRSRALMAAPDPAAAAPSDAPSAVTASSRI
jgi:hypothetical protein